LLYLLNGLLRAARKLTAADFLDVVLNDSGVGPRALMGTL
jgi:hypothetical protein